MASGSSEERTFEFTARWRDLDQRLLALLVFDLSVFNWFRAESMLSA